MRDESDPGATDREKRHQLPSSEQPLHGERRPMIGPVVITLGILAVAALLYLLGLVFLV